MDDGEQRVRHTAFPDHPPRRRHRRSPASRPNRRSMPAAQIVLIRNAPPPTNLTADPQTTISYLTSHRDWTQNVGNGQTPFEPLSNVTRRNEPPESLSRRVETFERATIRDPNPPPQSLSRLIQAYQAVKDPGGLEILRNDTPADPPPATSLTVFDHPERSRLRERSNVAEEPDKYSRLAYPTPDISVQKSSRGSHNRTRWDGFVHGLRNSGVSVGNRRVS